jgi:hypothetical protein
MKAAKAMTGGVTLQITATTALQLQLTAQHRDLQIAAGTMGGNGVG